MGTTLVGVLGVIVGVILSNTAVRFLEALRRRERIQDIRTALRAEIRSHRERLLLFREAVQSHAVADKIDESFTPFVPREAPSFVFQAIISEVHILPTEIIDPVVYYYRQIATVAEFAEDLRSERYLTLEPSRKGEMYRDYLSMGVYALQLADDAIEAIERSSVSRLGARRPGNGFGGR